MRATNTEIQSIKVILNLLNTMEMSDEILNAIDNLNQFVKKNDTIENKIKQFEAAYENYTPVELII
jgi:hypothetical protein